MLIRNTTVFGTGDTDVRWTRGHITECGRGLRPMPGEDDFDARGGWLVPGLLDYTTPPTLNEFTVRLRELHAGGRPAAESR